MQPFGDVDALAASVPCDGLRTKLGQETCADASAIDFLPFSDLQGSVREDVERIRRSPLIPEDVSIAGYTYDVDTGALTPVEGATT